MASAPSGDSHLNNLGGGQAASSGPIGRFLDLYIRDNPLVPRALGTTEGRSKFKSPMHWAVGLACLGVLIAFAFQLVMIVKGENIVSQPDAAAMVFRVTAILGAIAIWVIVGILPVYFSAISWHREMNPQRREEIGLTLITPRQIIGAMAVVWVLPGLISTALNLILQLILNLSALVSPVIAESPNGPLSGFSESNLSPGAAVLIMLGIMLIGIIQSLVNWFLVLYFTASNSLMGRGPVLSVVMAGLKTFGCYVLAIILAALAGMILGLLGLLGTPGATVMPVAGMVVGGAVALLILWLLLKSFWKKLPGRVATAFNLTDQ